MPVAVPVTEIACPKCEFMVTPVDGRATCSCGWRGEAVLFTPVEPSTADQPVEALPEDATCVHHASKRAEAVCAGTGDYICSLCAVDVGGETYSVQFLDRGGAKNLSQHFDRVLPRPDYFARNLLLLCLVPYVCVGMPVFYVMAVVQYFRFFRLRRENELFRRVTDGSTAVVLTLWLVLASLAVVVGMGLLITEAVV